MTTDAPLRAFKRAPSVETSTWYKGILISNLAIDQDTGGAFEFVVTKMRKGTEPPHVHEREHEMFYVLDGIIDVHAGAERFQATAGECVFLPKLKAHALKIQSSKVHMLVSMTLGGIMSASAKRAIPAQSLDIPPVDGVTYATINLDDTIKIFEECGIRFLLSDDTMRRILTFPRPQAMNLTVDN